MHPSNTQTLQHSSAPTLHGSLRISLTYRNEIATINLNEKQLTELWFYFQNRYRVVVLPVPSFETNLTTIKIKDIFDLLRRRTSLGDALMASVAKKHLPFISTMITWDNLHFKNIYHGTVLTPEEWSIGVME